MAEVPPLKLDSGSIERWDGTADSLQALSVGIGTSAPASGLQIGSGDLLIDASSSLVLAESSGDPGGTADQGKLYTKDSSGTTHLYYQDSGGTVHAVTPPGGGSGDAAVTVPFVAASLPVKVTTYSVVGAAEFDPSAWTSSGRTIKLVAELQTSDTSISCVLQLFNRTDNSVVSSGALSSTSQNPEKKTATLSVPGDLPNSSKDYEIQIKMGDASTVEAVRCLSAYFLLSWS